MNNNNFESFDSVIKKLTKAPSKSSSPYKMGYDAAVNGANTENCHFSIFSSKENTKEWERGNKDGIMSKKI